VTLGGPSTQVIILEILLACSGPTVARQGSGDSVTFSVTPQGRGWYVPTGLIQLLIYAPVAEKLT